jgi:ribonucleoside-diphosphate reductase alpha chain
VTRIYNELQNACPILGQAVPRRRALPARRHHITQKMKIAGQCTLYLSVHDDTRPAEIFLRVKGPDCSSELIGLYDVIARLMSIALQYGAPLEKFGDLLAGAKFAPCGPVSGHDRLKQCSSLPDLIGRHLLVEYCGREELAHVPLSQSEEDGQV